MTLLNYITIYFVTGMLFMLLLDVMHNKIKHLLEGDTKLSYTNFERIYVIIAWPLILFFVIKNLIDANKKI